MGEKKIHYKMYKDGKKMVFAAITTLSLLVSGGFSTVEVLADTASESAKAISAGTDIGAGTITQNERTVPVSYNDLINGLGTATKTASVEVNKDNFSQYFDLNGSATYDQSTGIVTITPDDNNQVGNFALKSKIDTNSSFTLTGQVNLGADPGGADGISFAFHNGNTTDLGNSGGNLGIGGTFGCLRL